MRGPVKLLQDKLWLRKFHGWATLVWLAASVPIAVLLNSSIPFLVFISVYAIVISHWSAWQSSRVEVQVDPDIDE